MNSVASAYRVMITEQVITRKVPWKGRARLMSSFHMLNNCVPCGAAIKMKVCLVGISVLLQFSTLMTSP